MSEKIAAWKYIIMFLGKARIIIRQCYAKKNVNHLEVSWKKALTKKYHSSNYALLTKVLHILSLLRTIRRTILVTCSRHSLFSHLNWLKSLRSLSSCSHVLTTFLSFSLLTGVLCCKVLQGCFYTSKQQYIKDDFKCSWFISSNFTKLHKLVIFFQYSHVNWTIYHSLVNISVLSWEGSHFIKFQNTVVWNLIMWNLC